MKKATLQLLLGLMALIAFAGPAAAEVLLSELCDPRNSYADDRFIEIWNSGTEAVDLTGWSVVAIGNGGDIFTWNLSGTIASGEALVCGDANTSDPFTVDFPQAAWSESNTTWNGKVDDGAKLVNNLGQVIDLVEALDTLFENSDLVRNEGVTTPSTSYNAAQWTATPVDIPTEGSPGSHFGAAAGDGPVLADIALVPAAPIQAEAAHVTATVTDAVANITAVTLNWGTSSGSLGNSIAMSVTTGDTWQTDTAIPGQSGGTSVYYRISADNDLPETSLSGELSYYVAVIDITAPGVSAVDAEGPNTVIVTFNEDVDLATAQTAGNYAISGYTVSGAVRNLSDQVTLTVSTLVSGPHSLNIDGVEDLVGNAMVSVNAAFEYYGGDIPVGYYNGTSGLTGEDLRGALHSIIDNHNSVSYTPGVWNAYYTTDVKANGKLWDMYSDTPGFTPPYEYTIGVDQSGSASGEGEGYNREHSWPKSWFDDASPMVTDIFMVVPSDVYVNNRRSNLPYGEVGSATWTSLNGCKVGNCVYPGYTGEVFEPRDDFKGDFARAYFYMSTRYYTEDGGWPGSPMVDGSQLLPWAENLLLDWSEADPVSQKEIDRNEAIYDIQGNRNPFIDRPDFILKVFRPELAPTPVPVPFEIMTLHQNVPNPFNPSTRINFELAERGEVAVQVYDMSGRLVRNLYSGHLEAGPHDVTWNGRDNRGRASAAGVYMYQVRSGDAVETKRMTLVK